MAQVVQPEQLVSLAYPAQRALLASAQQARWAQMALLAQLE